MENALSVTIPTRIDHAIAKENSRFAINGAHVRFRPDGEPIAEATDGHMLAVVECVGHQGEYSAIVPGHMLKKRKSGTSLEINGRISNGVVECDPYEGNFPPCADVAPRDLGKSHVAISLNPGLLKRLADSIGADRAVTLAVELNEDGTAPGKPIRVMNADNTVPAALGVLMPCKTNEPDKLGERWAGLIDKFYPRKNK